MNHMLNDPRRAWARLTAAARGVRDDRPLSAPYGFSTRVAALAFSQPRPVAPLFERFAIRALSVAALLALFSIALNYQVFSSQGPTTVSPQVEEAEVFAVDDAVAIVLDFAD